MLVLSRKLGEKVQIGDEITLTVVSISGNRVQLGIDAPDTVRILRGELLNRLTAPNESRLALDPHHHDTSDCWAAGELSSDTLAGA
jgi:carbon storage regulator